MLESRVEGLIPLGGLTPPSPEPPVSSLLSDIAVALREWRSPGCVSVSGGRVERGARVYWVLAKLGARYAPVERCDASLDELGIFADFDEYSGGVYSSTMELAVRGKPTPLVALRWSPGRGVRVWAKLEWFNPFSLSVKDRPALLILEKLGVPRGSRVYEASSGNFAVALSAVGAVLGYRVRVYLPGFAGGGYAERVARLLGAEVVVDERAEFTPQLLERLRRDAAEDGAVHPNQFTNDYNFEAHLRGTAREIDYQRLRGGLRLRGVVGGVGTSGHMAAVAFYFKSRLGEVDVVLAQPARGEVIPGIRRRETGMLWLDLAGVYDDPVDVTLDEALEVVAEVARSDGILLGPSGGAALAALRKHCESTGCMQGDYVAVIPDTGFKYLALVDGRAEAGSDG